MRPGTCSKPRTLDLRFRGPRDLTKCTSYRRIISLPRLTGLQVKLGHHNDMEEKNTSCKFVSLVQLWLSVRVSY